VIPTAVEAICNRVIYEEGSKDVVGGVDPLQIRLMLLSKVTSAV
jgi:hypothetical protein